MSATDTLDRRSKLFESAGARALASPLSTEAKVELFASLIFVLFACGALFVDVPISHYLDEHRLRGDLLKILTLSEVFAHGYGVAAILLTAWVLLPEKSRQVGRVALLAISAGLMVNLVKCMVMRVRPEHFDLTRPAFESFVGFFTFAAPAGFSRYLDFRLHSFPSGHTAMAVALAIGLTRLAPRGKFVFIAFAVAAACQRIVTRDHYLSDTFAAAAVTLLVSSAQTAYWDRGNSSRSCASPEGRGELVSILVRREA